MDPRRVPAPYRPRRPGPAERHEWLSTAPASPFVRWLTVQRRDAHGVDAVIGSVLHHFPDGEATGLDTRDDWLAVLHDRFGAALDAGERDALWTRVQYSR